MKKLFIALLLPLIFIISGCNNESNVTKEVIDTDETEETEDKETEEFEQQLKELLVDSYEKESIKEYRHVDVLLSKDLTQRLNESLEQSTPEFYETREVKDYELYKSEDNPNKYIYYIILNTTDKENGNKVDTDHYGIVYLVNEDNKKKIDYLMEIQANERE